MKTVKSNKVLPVAVATLAVLLTGAVLSVSAQEPQTSSLDSKSSTQQENVLQDRGLFKAVHQEAKAALEAGDYQAWVKAVSQLPMAEEHSDKITEENFDQMVEAHRLMEAGDKEGAKAILDELGIRPFQMKFGHHFQQKFTEQLTQEQQEAVKKAMESKDPEAVKALLEEYGVKMPETREFAHLTEEQKAALKTAFESEDKDAVKALMEEYGVEMPKMERMEFRHDLKVLTDEQKEALKSARQNGDQESVKALMEDYGIEKPEGSGFGMGHAKWAQKATQQ